MTQGAIRSVLVPVDFSEASRAAATRAGWIAKRLGASLHLVHATQHRSLAGGGGRSSPWLGSEIANELARKELSAFVAELEPLGPPITGDVVDQRPIAAVHEAIREGKADLVVLGVHAQHSLWHLLGESTSDRAIRLLPVPVLAVKEEGVAASTPLRQLLMVTDFSPCSDRALRFAIRLAKGVGARLDVLHALSPKAPMALTFGSTPSREWLAGARNAAERDLRAAVDRVHLDGVEGHPHLMDGDPVEAIARRVAAMEIDLIVMGTRGHTGLKHRVRGSTAEKLVHQVQCSVAVVH